MKVLLINPSFSVSKFGRFARFMEPMPCLGLAYIAAVLEKNNIYVEIIDDFVLKLGTSGILKVVKEKGFDVVGISCLTPSAPEAFSISREIKKYNNKILTVLGNIHATVFAEEILKNEAVDVIVHGEGEYSIVDLVHAVEENTDFGNIKGISFRQEEKIVKTPSRDLIGNLDELPYPAWHLFPYKQYGFLPFVDIKRHTLSVSISGSRGCLYNCSFCSLPNVKYRQRDPKKIVDEIEYLIGRYHVRQLGFVDPIFPLHKKQGLEFCAEMIKRGLNGKVSWLCETRVDLVDKELLRAMRSAGCRRIIYGIESGVEELLGNVVKSFGLEDIRRAIRNTQEAGILTTGLFMLGLPGETKEMAQKTIDFAKEIKVDFAKFAITVPYPGSRLYENLVSSGELQRRDWENFVTFNPNPEDLVYIPGGMSPSELIKMQQKAHFEFYVRPQIILKQLFKIRTIRLKDLLLGFLCLLFSRLNTRGNHK
jgi:anaerobic magnesium-protoporphyrin IX monomethyl ester cyclase